MAKCTLIRSLHDSYDSTVISALEAHGYQVDVIPFEKSAEAFGGFQLVDILSTSCFGLSRRMQISSLGFRRRTKVRQGA